MNKISLIIIGVVLLVTTVEADTNNYVSADIGIININTEHVSDSTTTLGGVAIGRLFKDNKFALELEFLHLRLSEEKQSTTTSSVNTTSTTTSDPTTTNPVRPGNGGGHGHGWHRRNPPVITPGTNVVTTTSAPSTDQASISTSLRVSYLMMNGIYNLNTDGRFSPYALIGAGVAYTEYEHISSTSIFAYQAGLGLAVRLAEWAAVTAEARYMSSFYDTDISLGGATALVGVQFHF